MTATPATGPRTATFLLRQPRQVQGFREVLTAGNFQDAYVDGGYVDEGYAENEPAPRLPSRSQALTLTMLWIPPGRFWMGSPELSERPQHQVQVQGFFMSQTPITQAQWRAVAELDEQVILRHELKPNPSVFHPDQWQGQNRKMKYRLGRLLDGESTTEDRPVESVSWHEALEFCHRLGRLTGRSYTLPSEAQWEYSCLAGSTKPYAFGASINPGLANYRNPVASGSNISGAHFQQTTPVRMFPANAWGLHDVHGNVREWCFDHWHENYEGSPDDCSPWLEKDGRELLRERVTRGGSWNSKLFECRATCRHSSPPHVADEKIGFRVACVPHASISDATHRTGSFFEIDHLSTRISIDQLELSGTSRASLIKAGVNTVEDLMGFSYEDLLDIESFDKRDADELIQALERAGITMPQEKHS
jgi:formylglycine-generating enzyme required for sulfatase activity